MVLEVNATLTINEAILGRRDLPRASGKSPQKAAQEVVGEDHRKGKRQFKPQEGSSLNEHRVSVSNANAV